MTVLLFSVSFVFVKAACNKVRVEFSVFVSVHIDLYLLLFYLNILCLSEIVDSGLECGQRVKIVKRRQSRPF